MSFSKTISVFAALASIFGAGAAGWKLTQESQDKPIQQDVSVFEEKINQLEEKLKEKEETPQTQQPVVVQQPAIWVPPLPPLPPSPEPKPGEFE
jgi:predicted negative regulator of RcsB-dependent stress response